MGFLSSFVRFDRPEHLICLDSRVTLLSFFDTYFTPGGNTHRQGPAEGETGGTLSNLYSIQDTVSPLTPSTTCRLWMSLTQQCISF